MSAYDHSVFCHHELPLGFSVFEGLASSSVGMCRNKDETARDRRIVAISWVFSCGGNMNVHPTVIFHTVENGIALYVCLHTTVQAKYSEEQPYFPFSLRNYLSQKKTKKCFNFTTYNLCHHLYLQESSQIILRLFYKTEKEKKIEKKSSRK